MGILFFLHSGLASSFPFLGFWFTLDQFFNGVYSGSIWSRVYCPLGFIFLNSCLVHSELWVCSGFFLGSLWVCSKSLLNWDLLVASLTYRSFDLDLLFTVINSGPTCLNSRFARSGFSSGFSLVYSRFIQGLLYIFQDII